jgi:branched-subunit amino acid transport protein
VTDVWIVVALSGLGSIALKGAGPILLGGRPLPARVSSVLSLAAPALLAALIATGTFADGQDLVLDARAAGVAVGAVAVASRAPALVVVIVAAVATALVRGLLG